MNWLTIFRDPWTLETLGDFWRVGRWMRAQRRHGRADAALVRYLERMTVILRQGVDRYDRLAGRLDSASSQLLRISPGPRAQEKAGQVSLLHHIHDRAEQLRPRLGKLASLSRRSMLPQWEKILSDTRSFTALLNAIVLDLGCFEQVLHVLPGTGPVICRASVQACLGEMFAINMRNIRLLEFIHPIWLAWRGGMGGSGGRGDELGFFRSCTDCNQLLRSMLIQYMTEANPDLVLARRQRAALSGRRPTAFRFWRPAECLRQLAGLTYVGPDAAPKPTRAYVDIRSQKVPVTWTDQERLEWALREIFNNAVAATSRMFLSEGEIVVRPLERHEEGPPVPAVSLALERAAGGSWLRRRPVVRIVIADRGDGIDPAHRDKVMLWGFSTKREKHHLPAASEDDGEPILIGGKGMGLPYSAWVLAEHGGRLILHSRPGEGTQVVLELPIGVFG